MRQTFRHLWLPFLLSLVLVAGVSLTARVLFDAHVQAVAQAASDARSSMALVCRQ